MRARIVVLSLTLVSASPALNHVRAQQRPINAFRSGREILTIETSVDDADGRPLTDLKPSDFLVRIDGVPRQVHTAQPFGSDKEHIRAGAPPIPRFSRSADGSSGRIVVLAIDRDSMKSGSEMAAINTAARMLDALSPADAVGLVALPVGGVELTRDHERVSDAIRTMTGTASNPMWQHVLSWDEALAYERGDSHAIEAAVDRECTGGSRTQSAMDVVPCPTALGQQAREMLSSGRGHAVMVLTRLTDVLNRLRALQAPKQVVLISGGLPFDTELLSRYKDLAAKAAEAHVAMFVVHLDQPSFDASGRVAGGSVSGRDYATGLGSIAASTGGAFFSAVGRATGVFDRIATDINHFYELGIESRPADADGKPHTVEVAVNRPGARVRAPAATVVASPSAAKPSVASVLAEPTDLGELPIEVATYTLHATDRSKVRLLLAATLTTPGKTPPAAWGYAIMAGEAQVARRDINIDAATEQPWSATASIELPAGHYRVRTAVIDADGRAGSVDIPVTAALRAAGTLRASELLIGTAAEGRLQPRARLRRGEPAAAMIELSSAEPITGTTGVLEVIRGGTAQAVLRQPLKLRVREEDTSVIVGEGPIDLSALAPGIYTASVMLEHEGAAFTRISRVFEVTAGIVTTAAPPGAPAGAAPRSAALDEIMQRVGGYVANYGLQASLLVGVEHYDQQFPNAPLGFPTRRRLVAEFALVRAADAIGWVGFRDVIEVDGKPVHDRQDRLQSLFRAGAPDLVEARRIADESARFNIGPTQRNFNEPTAVLFFLGPSLQARFAFSEKGDATIERTPVVEIGFKEKARPTLIRTHDGGDVASQGSLWVIPTDGTVVRTKLVVSGFAGQGTMSSIEVTYARDPRLALWLPVTMIERNEGVVRRMSTARAGLSATQPAVVTARATYSNFKRFETSATVR